MVQAHAVVLGPLCWDPCAENQRRRLCSLGCSFEAPCSPLVRAVAPLGSTEVCHTMLWDVSLHCSQSHAPLRGTCQCLLEQPKTSCTAQPMGATTWSLSRALAETPELPLRGHRFHMLCSRVMLHKGLLSKGGCLHTAAKDAVVLQCARACYTS